MNVKDLVWKDTTKRKGWKSYSAYIEGYDKALGSILYSPDKNKWYNTSPLIIEQKDSTIHDSSDEAKKEFEKMYKDFIKSFFYNEEQVALIWNFKRNQQGHTEADACNPVSGEKVGGFYCVYEEKFDEYSGDYCSVGDVLSYRFYTNEDRISGSNWFDTMDIETGKQKVQENFSKFLDSLIKD